MNNRHEKRFTRIETWRSGATRLFLAAAAGALLLAGCCPACN